MLKEFTICTMIIVGILVGNGISQGYSRNSIEDINEKLTGLEETIVGETVKQEKDDSSQEMSDEEDDGKSEEINKEEVNSRKEEIIKKEEEIYKQWDDMFAKLAYYIEHEELEKFSRNLENLKTYMRLEQYDNAIKEINEGIFILNHIEDKYSFNLQNIF